MTTSFLELPPEIRLNVYRQLFAPLSTEPAHQVVLTITKVDRFDRAAILLGRKEGTHYERPANYKFLFTCKQILEEALRPLAEITSLRLSNMTFNNWEFDSSPVPLERFHPCHFPKSHSDHRLRGFLVGPFFKEVATWTTHLIVDQPVICDDLAFAEALLANKIFPCVEHLTIHHAGSAEIFSSTRSLTLDVPSAIELYRTKQWPVSPTSRGVSTKLKDVLGSYLLPYEKLPIAAEHNFRLHSGFDRTPIYDLLREFRAKVNAQPLRTRQWITDHESREVRRLAKIEVVFCLTLRALEGTAITSVDGKSINFDRSEVTVDYDSNQITEVTFSKTRARAPGRPWNKLHPTPHTRFWAMDSKSTASEITT